MKKLKKLLIFLILLAIVIASINLFMKLLSYDMNPFNVESTYTNKSSIETKVNLKEEGLYNPTESYFLSKYIEDVDFNFDYAYTSEFEKDLKYEMSVKTVLELTHSSSGSVDDYEISTFEEVLKKEEILSSEKKYNFSYDETLDLNDYISTIEEFKEGVDIPVNAVLNVVFVVKVNDENTNKRLSSHENKISIELTEDVYFIKDKEIKGEEIKIYQEKDNYTFFQKIIAMIVLILSITFLLVFIKIHIIKEKNNYEKRLEKILNTYDDIIVNTDNMIDKSKYEVVRISEFKELLNLEKEKNSPIFIYKTNKKAELYIIIDNIMYICVIK